MAQWVNPMPANADVSCEILVCVPAAPSLTQLPVNVLGRAAEGGPRTWAPATHMRDLGFLASAWTCLSSCGRWGTNQKMEDRSLSNCFLKTWINEDLFI